MPRFSLIFAGKPHPGKKACFNTIMKDWKLNGDALRKAGELKEDECPFLEPSAFVACMKALSSEMQDCNIHFNVESGHP